MNNLQPGTGINILNRRRVAMVQTVSPPKRRMNLSKFKAVFFDVGGTLLRVHPSVGEVYARHAVAFGFHGTAEGLDKQFRISWKKSGGLESLGTRSGKEVERTFWYDLVFEVFRPFGGLRAFDSYFELIYKVFQSGESWRVYDDVVKSNILAELRRRGVVLGVVSNWDSRLQNILQNTGLAHHFDFILASTVVGSAKPDEKIFHLALLQSGVAPHEACHIGDELTTDILGARKLGISTFLVDRKGCHPDAPTCRINSFLDLTRPVPQHGGAV